MTTKKAKKREFVIPNNPIELIREVNRLAGGAPKRIAKWSLDKPQMGRDNGVAEDKTDIRAYTSDIIKYLEYFVNKYKCSRKEWIKLRRIFDYITKDRGANIGYDRRSHTHFTYKSVLEAVAKGDDSALSDTINYVDQLFSVRENSSLENLLIEAGIPEIAMGQNLEAWHLARYIERNGVVSLHKTFHVTDVYGDGWVYKIHSDREKAQFEADVSRILSRHFDFVAPMYDSDMVQAGEVYVVRHRKSTIVSPRSAEYWMASLAEFHTKAEGILKEGGTALTEYNLEEKFEKLKEKYLTTKKAEDLHIDMPRLKDAITKLEKSGYRTAIHSDLKRDNMLGLEKMIDMEAVSLGDPAIDIAMTLMSLRVPEETWDRYLNNYLKCAGVSIGSMQSELRSLKDRVEAAKYLMSIKMRIDSAEREIPNISKSTREHNGALSSYSTTARSDTAVFMASRAA